MLRRWLWVIIVFSVLIACSFPADWLANNRNDRAGLTVDIQYEGDFYTEVFGYTPDAGNIRHIVLVLPETLAARTNSPGWIFTSIEPRVEGGMVIRDDRQEYQWALDYLYEAPGGVFSGVFKPGRYAVAAAFLAGPLSREEAGVGDDVLLWPGVTGGGASTEYRIVELVAGETMALTFAMTDANGWACPWLYVFDGTSYQRTSEILRNLRGMGSQRLETTPLSAAYVIDGAIHLRVAEEKDETTTLDALYLLVDGVPVYASDSRLGAVDGAVVTLGQGDSFDLRFGVGDLAGDASMVVVAVGYYVPENETTGSARPGMIIGQTSA